jgi:hypothetical protein
MFYNTVPGHIRTGDNIIAYLGLLVNDKEKVVLGPFRNGVLSATSAEDLTVKVLNNLVKVLPHWALGVLD